MAADDRSEPEGAPEDEADPRDGREEDAESEGDGGPTAAAAEGDASADGRRDAGDLEAAEDDEEEAEAVDEDDADREDEEDEDEEAAARAEAEARAALDPADARLLAEVEAAYAVGNHRRLRSLLGRLAASEVPYLRDLAPRYRGRISVDPVEVVLVLSAALVFLTIVFTWLR